MNLSMELSHDIVRQWFILKRRRKAQGKAPLTHALPISPSAPPRPIWARAMVLGVSWMQAWYALRSWLLRLEANGKLEIFNSGWWPQNAVPKGKDGKRTCRWSWSMFSIDHWNILKPSNTLNSSMFLEGSWSLFVSTGVLDSKYDLREYLGVLGQEKVQTKAHAQPAHNDLTKASLT